MIQLILGGLVLTAATGLGGFVYGVNVGINKERASQASVQQAADKAAEAVASKAAEAISKIEVVNKTVYQKATHEIRKEPVYIDCRNTDGVFNSINDALRGPAKGAGKGGVPGTDGTDRQGLRGDSAQADRSGGAVSQVPGSRPQ